MTQKSFATKEEAEQFHNLFADLSRVMEGHSDDDLVPALATLMAMVGSESGASKRSLLSYVAGVIDHVYAEFGHTPKH